MSDFADRMKRQGDWLGGRVEDIVATAAQMALQSIQYGSTVTGARGQPVDTGNLLRSWQAERIGPYEWTISTNSDYANQIEDGISWKTGLPMTLHSTVGGFFSVRTTVINFDRILEHAVRAHRDSP